MGPGPGGRDCRGGPAAGLVGSGLRGVLWRGLWRVVFAVLGVERPGKGARGCLERTREAHGGPMLVANTKTKTKKTIRTRKRTRRHAKGNKPWWLSRFFFSSLSLLSWTCVVFSRAARGESGTHGFSLDAGLKCALSARAVLASGALIARAIWPSAWSESKASAAECDESEGAARTQKPGGSIQKKWEREEKKGRKRPQKTRGPGV